MPMPGVHKQRHRTLKAPLLLSSFTEELAEMSGNHVAISGDFSRIFEPSDYMAMVNTSDQAACVLRGHLVLEEFLHLWIDKVTSTDDMFRGVFVPFKSKLQISKNLGLSQDHFEVLDKINTIRNKFGHRKGYEVELSTLDSLAEKIDGISEPEKTLPSREFVAYISGKDQNGNRVDKEFNYPDSDGRMKFIILFVVYMLKLSWWLQSEFNNRNIEYTIIEGLPS
tara:strand:- start:57 stop:728 length:672 start_codon:yes stop_codon:yes gene_type:complete